MSSEDPIVTAKRAAAYAAVDAWFSDDLCVGVGSGSTVVFAAERLGQLVKEHGARNVVCVPTSFQSEGLIRDNGLTLSTLNATPALDVAFDGADEIDGQLNAIKGGGGAHTQEKLVASAASVFVLLVDESKVSDALGTRWAVPVEVISSGYVVVTEALKKMGAQDVVLRMAKAKAGPVVTDNGNFILDASFGPIPKERVASLAAQINNIAGVVENGLFPAMAHSVYIGCADGSAEMKTPVV